MEKNLTNVLSPQERAAANVVENKLKEVRNVIENAKNLDELKSNLIDKS